MQTIFVSRFVADSLVQQASDDAVIHDDEENVEVQIAPQDIDYDALEAYTADQLGNGEQAKKDAVESVNDDFDGIDRTSSEVITFFWES